MSRRGGSPGRERIRDQSGFTLVELLIGVVIGLAVLGAAYSVLASQGRLYSLNRERMDANESLRESATLLGWELMNAAASEGDLSVIGPNSFTVRAIQGSGVLCARVDVAGTDRFALQQVFGSFDATADDSALVYLRATDSWGLAKVDSTWNGGAAWTGGGTPVCHWGDSTTAMPRPEATVELQASAPTLAGLERGAPIRTFRRTEYALFQQNGRWWLGRKFGNAASYEVVTGPMASPGNGGLVLTYLDAAGVATADPALVARVDISLRAESFKIVRRYESGGIGTVSGQFSTSVSLRNNASP